MNYVNFGLFTVLPIMKYNFVLIAVLPSNYGFFWMSGVQQTCNYSALWCDDCSLSNTTYPMKGVYGSTLFTDPPYKMACLVLQHKNGHAMTMRSCATTGLKIICEVGISLQYNNNNKYLLRQETNFRGNNAQKVLETS